MHTTHQGMAHGIRLAGSHPRGVLTDSAVTNASVRRRLDDPSLLSRRAEPSSADSSTAIAA